MFSPSKILALFAIAAAGSSAVVVRRAESPLSVDISTPSGSVASIKDLVFTAKVTNTGSEDVKVLKYGTVLDSLPTRSFSVAKDGSDVSFNGVKLSVDLNAGDAAYTTIAAGQTVEVQHDVSSIYDFATVGTGKFSFTPNTSFKVASAAEKVAVSALESVSVDTSAFEVEVTEDVAQPVRRRATPTCSNSSQLDFIDSSYSEAKELANVGLDYVSSGGSLVSDYFSSNSESSVTGVLDAVASEGDSSRTLSCTDDYGVCDGNVIAYTLIATTDIYYCDIFFDEVASTELCGGTTVANRNVRGGTTLHELTHAVADTDDITYGCDTDQSLSASQQISNADNFNCFTTAAYAETQC